MRDVLEHYTRQTGDLQQIRRSEAKTDMARRVAPVVGKAIQTGEIVDLLKTGWHMAAVESPGRLQVRLYVRTYSADPVITFTVRTGDYTANGRARLEVDLLLGCAGAPVARLLEARSLERCIAWAWLDR